MGIIINDRLKYFIELQNYLRGFRNQRNTGTSTITSKILHHITDMHQKYRYEIFIDLHKPHETLDRERTLNDM